MVRHEEHGGRESGSRQGCKPVTPTSAGSSVWRCQGLLIQGCAGSSEHRFSSAFEWTGQRTAGKWELAGSFIKCPNKHFFSFSLAAIKGRRLNQDIHSKQLSPWWIAGTCPQPALLDGSDHGLGKKPRGRGRNAHQLCPSPAIALLMEQREIISLVLVHHLPTAQRRRRKTTDIPRHFAR